MPAHLPRLLIVGGGFGGLFAARALRRAPLRITLLDRTNHHLFQPLLYQVATASLSPSDIAQPLRWILRRQENAQVLLGEAVSVDLANKRVIVAPAQPSEDGLDCARVEVGDDESGQREAGSGDGVVDDGLVTDGFDYLILATGTRHGYFGHDNWEPLAPGLKSLEDARTIRQRFLLAFERAELECDPVARRPLLTFVIVGGGPTGVELAGAMSEIARQTMRREFRRFDPRRETRILLLEGGERILSTYPESLSLKAQRSLEKLGVEVRTGAIVTDVDEAGVCVGTARIEAANVFWAAGNVASPLARTLGVPLDKSGRVIVEPDLSLPGFPFAFAIGDMAVFTHQTGEPLPGVAPVAMQQARRAADNVLRLMQGRSTRAFHYRDRGNLATIGRAAAVADLGRLRLWGFLAWVAWLFIHIFFLIGFRNRVLVLIQWAWLYFTYQRGARLITGEPEARMPRPPPTGDVSSPSESKAALPV
jgi:NADH dehydrogenase